MKWIRLPLNTNQPLKKPSHIFCRGRKIPVDWEIDDLRLRIVSAIEKYILRDEPNAPSSDIQEFIESIRADDLCLIIACEKGDEIAWGDLVLNFDQTVKSAAYKYAKNKEDADDLAGSIWAELHGLKLNKEGKKKSKLSYYSGQRQSCRLASCGYKSTGD